LLVTRREPAIFQCAPRLAVKKSNLSKPAAAATAMSSKVASAKPWSPAVGLAGPHEAAPEDRAASGADNGVVGPNERWSVDFMRDSL
jgi:hypothetical protein